MAWTPTTEQILNLDGVRRRADAFRFELCDRDLRPIGDLHPDRSSVPTIENDASNNTSRRLRGLRLHAGEAAAVNPISDRVRVYMVLQNGDEHRLGTFLWVDASRPARSWGDQHDGELVDFTYILDQQATQAFSWGPGGTISLILFFLLFRAGLKLSDVATIGQEANRGLAEPKAWSPGTTWIQMLTELGDLVGFAAPWFDRDGRIHLDQPPDPDIVGPTVVSYDTAPRMITDSIVPSDDIIGAPNDFAMFDSGTSLLRLGRYQLPTSAPHSFANRGYRVGLVESVQGLATQAQADKSAFNLARTRGVAYEWLSFSSTADPRHDTWDVVEALGKRWLETSWSLPCSSGGAMTHTMKRVSYGI